MQSDNVFDLTDSTLESTLEKYDYVFCMFEGPKHASCGTTIANYNRTADQLTPIIPNVRFATVDCEVEKEVSAKYGIGSDNYHTTKVLFKGGSETIEAPTLEKYDIVFCLFDGPRESFCATTQLSFYCTAQEFASISQDIGFAAVDCKVEKELCEKYGIGDDNYHTIKALFKDGRSEFADCMTPDEAIKYLKKQSPEKYGHLTAPVRRRFDDEDD